MAVFAASGSYIYCCTEARADGLYDFTPLMMPKPINPEPWEVDTIDFSAGRNSKGELVVFAASEQRLLQFTQEHDLRPRGSWTCQELGLQGKFQELAVARDLPGSPEGGSAVFVTCSDIKGIWYKLASVDGGWTKVPSVEHWVHRFALSRRGDTLTLLTVKEPANVMGSTTLTASGSWAEWARLMAEPASVSSSSNATSAAPDAATAALAALHVSSGNDIPWYWWIPLIGSIGMLRNLHEPDLERQEFQNTSNQVDCLYWALGALCNPRLTAEQLMRALGERQMRLVYDIQGDAALMQDMDRRGLRWWRPQAGYHNPAGPFSTTAEAEAAMRSHRQGTVFLVVLQWRQQQGGGIAGAHATLAERGQQDISWRELQFADNRGRAFVGYHGHAGMYATNIYFWACDPSSPKRPPDWLPPRHDDF